MNSTTNQSMNFVHILEMNFDISQLGRVIHRAMKMLTRIFWNELRTTGSNWMEEWRRAFSTFDGNEHEQWVEFASKCIGCKVCNEFKCFATCIAFDSNFEMKGALAAVRVCIASMPYSEIGLKINAHNRIGSSRHALNMLAYWCECIAWLK